MMRMASGTGMAEPACTNDAARLQPPAEPATLRALWPTFMRRTLAEEDIARPRLREAAE